MNPIETGKAIASLRKMAGYTQATLAEALDVSDKAVSKWERGIACPDIALLPKLSILLDTDIEGIVSGNALYHPHDWKGVVFVDQWATEKVFSKPLVYFMLSNFMLVGIHDILVIGVNADDLKRVQDILGDGSQFGLRLTYGNEYRLEYQLTENYMVMYGNAVIYGANLTRIYQRMMSFENNVALQTYSEDEVPFLFCGNDLLGGLLSVDSVNMMKELQNVKKRCEKRRFGRGVVCLPLNNNNQLCDASNFIRIIENTANQPVGDLMEIAQSRGLIQNT